MVIPNEVFTLARAKKKARGSSRASRARQPEAESAKGTAARRPEPYLVAMWGPTPEHAYGIMWGAPVRRFNEGIAEKTERWGNPIRVVEVDPASDR